MNLTKWICRIPRWLGGGHLRGKRCLVSTTPAAIYAAGKTMYQCPRCHATWTRKIKQSKSKDAL